MLGEKKNNSDDDFQTDVARTSSCCNGNGRLCSLPKKKQIKKGKIRFLKSKSRRQFLTLGYICF